MSLPVRRMPVAFIAMFAAASALAQQAPDFAPDAKPLGADALRERVSGKVFHVVVARGPAWRLQLRDDGWFFLNAGNYADSGKWRIEESNLCWEPQRTKASCNEMRLLGELVHMKRDNGEIVKLEPR